MLMKAESAASMFYGSARRPLWLCRKRRIEPVMPDLFRWIRFLPRIFYVRNGLEFDIGKFAVHVFDTANINVLDDVARGGIDCDRAARAVGAFPIRKNLHRLVAVELALGLFDHLVDRGHAIPATDRKEI